MRLFLILAATLYNLNIQAQILFTKNYLYSGDDDAKCIATNDNGFLFFGSVDTQHVMTLMKVDSLGTVSWSKEYRFPWILPAYVIQTHDSGFLVAATGLSYSWVWGFGKPAVILIRLNNLGDTLWIKNYASADNIDIGSVIETKEKNFVISIQGSFQSGTSFSFIDAVDSVGHLLWTIDSPWGMLVSSHNGGYMIFQGPYAFKLDSMSSIISGHYYSTFNNFSCTHSSPTPDGGYLNFYVYSGGQVLMKIDSTLSPVWAIKPPNWIYELKVLSNGEIIMGSLNGWFRKLNNSGSLIYDYSFNNLHANFVTAFDGMPAIYGVDNIVSSVDDDIYLYRTDSIGSNLCLQQTPMFPDTIFPLPLDSELINPSSVQGGDIEWQYASVPIQNRIYSEIDGCILANQPAFQEPIQIIVFPNPSHGSINIKSPININYIRIIDTSGRVVWDKDILGSKEQSIQINHLSRGFYFLEISTNKQLLYKKFILEN